MLKYLIILLMPLFMLSCTKKNQVKVTYEATAAVSGYSLSYLENGTMKQISIVPESAQDRWFCHFNGEQGDIVYISGNYKDVNSALNLMIKVDGKIYKQGTSQGDTLRFLTVSGVVPYK
jgi:hypothetical protein